jgi:predicted nucleic acid-binding protein
MNFVIDASVAIKWFIEEDLSERAWHVLGSGQRLLAPAFLCIEMANIIWKKTMRGEIGREQATLILEHIALPAFISEFIRDDVLLETALARAIDLKHPVYDCLYIACAEAADATLVTSDARLLRLLSSPAFSLRHVALAQVHDVLGS